ncbi:3-oxoacyl-[acyl-carrier-protein] reductase [Pigmentiphaga soli]|uniref:3-oxoacyl-[acyl-carrier-protein] reductase n=1 Tax=Pigmentiphaga soli TaxID=1007095 RepID=A0ABP8GCZ3_9BURK
MNRELEGQVALVTGAAINIGRAIALSLADAGASVAVNTRQSREPAQAVVDEIRAAGGRAGLFMADITDAGAVKAMVDDVVGTFGRLDILVLNASVRREVPFVDMDFDEWRRTMSTTLDGSFHCLKASIPHLIAAGGGNIVTLGGDTTLDGAVRKAHNSAAKAGLAGLGRSLAKELAQFGIRVNMVSPGDIKTTRPAHRTPRPEVPPHIPLGRYGEPDEIAATVRFLCGAGGAFITGQVIHVNGGTLLGN